MYAGPVLGRKTRLYLLVHLATCTALTVGMIGTRIYLTVAQWDALDPGFETRLGRAFPIALIVLETLLVLPVALLGLKRLWDDRLGLRDVLRLGAGMTVYWLAVLAAAAALVADGSEGLAYGFYHYIVIGGVLMGLWALMTLWALWVYFVALKRRRSGSRNVIPDQNEHGRKDSVHLTDRTSTSKPSDREPGADF